MLPIINRALLFILTLLLPITNSIATEQTYLLTKAQLKCLYAQVDSLLSEPVDPVVILLTTPCDQSNSPPLPSGEKTELPVLNPTIGSEATATLKPEDILMLSTELPVLNPTIGSEATATLKPEDILMLSKAQLICFQQQFNQLMQQPSDAIQVTFQENCPSGTTHE